MPDLILQENQTLKIQNSCQIIANENEMLEDLETYNNNFDQEEPNFFNNICTESDSELSNLEIKEIVPLGIADVMKKIIEIEYHFLSEGENVFSAT